VDSPTGHDHPFLLLPGKGTNIRGRIVAASPGSALDRIRIHLESTSESDFSALGYGLVQRDGSFEIREVSDGNYALQVYGMEQTL
jgi:hypothetical protein